MAFWRGRKRLVCFYCGSKSKYIQDGSVRDWRCVKCDVVNYLDENGEITDPPVAELHSGSSSIKYAQAVPQFDSAAPSKSESNLFCDACLKNQHLFTSSLAQYIPDESNPFIDRKYFKFREGLEKRYPQVCEDCAPRVLERYNRSQYVAKADHMRRLMDRTRKYGGPVTSRRSWIDTVGRVLYGLGIIGQICWNLVGIYRIIRSHFLETCGADEVVYEDQYFTTRYVSAALISLICRFINLSSPLVGSLGNSIPIQEGSSHVISRLAEWSFWSSVLSMWWNPRMKQLISGFDSHLKNLSDWYKYHVILLIARVVFRSIMGRGALNMVDESAALGAHSFMLGFTIFVAVVAPRSIKSVTSRLFIPLTSEKLRPHVGRSVYKGSDNTLDPLVRVAPLPAENSDKISKLYQDPKARISDGSLCPSPSKKSTMVPISQQVDDDTDGEEMDWDPAPSQHLDFKLTQAPRGSQLLSQPIATGPSPFKGKLPPAPISMAHKLRNPPNQARLQPPTREAKENFFNSMNGRPIIASNDMDEATGSTSHRRTEIELFPAKFFPDNGDDPTGLTEAFESAFRLGPDEASVGGEKVKLMEIKNLNWTHLSRALVLLLSFFAWKYATTYPFEKLAHLRSISMVVCGLIGLFSVHDYTISLWAKKQSKSVVVFGGILGSVQTLSASYIIYNITARSSYSEAPDLQGALLISTMLIQEALFVAFRRD